MSRLMAASAAASAAAPASPTPRRSQVNDLDLKNWKQYEEIVTDSLWIIPERDSTGVHRGDYHGNFVPQIPHQVMMRYTKKGEAVFDPFLGSGTTLIEAQRMGRHALGVELQAPVAAAAKARLSQEANPHGSAIKVINEDCRSSRTKIWALNFLKELGRTHFQCAVLHPPYHDIIKFSDDTSDLSNAASTEEFLSMFDEVLAQTIDLLEEDRYLALVIGDKYDGGQWIPLGFYTMQRALARGLTLKSVVVKNMTGNRAKRNVENLWRYRALYGGFYIFRHEYVILFKK
ncbi:MAG: DNA methyltransferase [Candidatus Wallbacteria bacterium]|nr:DNA methyltransferase [Candidatus Wallbacteria bacterium]